MVGAENVHSSTGHLVAPVESVILGVGGQCTPIWVGLPGALPLSREVPLTSLGANRPHTYRYMCSPAGYATMWLTLSWRVQAP